MSSVTTFYSYKGGSGRSMALANVAWALASNGERVLTIDWDLEAPGLHRYFHPFLRDPGQTNSRGLIDEVWNYVAFMEANESAEPGYFALHSESIVQKLDMPIDGPGEIHFIGAGRQDELYSAKVGGLNWSDFYARFDGERFIDSIVEWARSKYTHILVDSRTGVADTAGICTTLLPDTVVFCFVYNRQSIEGSAAIARSVAAARETRKERVPEFIICPSRVEDRSSIDAARRHTMVHLRGIPGISPGRVQKELRSYEIKHYPWCAFEEKLAIFEEEADELGTLLEAMHVLAGRISKRDLTRHSIDHDVLARYWRRAAFVDPRLAELEETLETPSDETHVKLLTWADEALRQENERYDWISRLAEACVEEGAEPSKLVDGSTSSSLVTMGMELARRAYAQDAKGYYYRLSRLLQLRADQLKLEGNAEAAYDLAREASALLKDDTDPIGKHRYLRAEERVAELELKLKGLDAVLPTYIRIAAEYRSLERRSVKNPQSHQQSLRFHRILAERYYDAGMMEDSAKVSGGAIGRARRLITASSRWIDQVEFSKLLGIYVEASARLDPNIADVAISDAEKLAQQHLRSEMAIAHFSRSVANARAVGLAGAGKIGAAFEELSVAEEEGVNIATIQLRVELLLSQRRLSEAQIALSPILSDMSRPLTSTQIGLVRDAFSHVERIENARSLLNRAIACPYDPEVDEIRAIFQSIIHRQNLDPSDVIQKLLGITGASSTGKRGPVE
ncbi:KGGVGR-motif variant AAA ATPase [Dongia sp.]|uniref:KGGVGR-motif variant AAA ATPase n=1 Tax=Dongia sp. TaxID=1977262 RepID=UPI0035AE1EF3